MSDFYTPRFFDPLVAPGVRYSFTGALTEPRQVLRGGYLSWARPGVRSLVADRKVPAAPLRGSAISVC